MATLDNDNWFTEICEESGSAFSLRGRKVHEEQSQYQTIAIYETTDFGNLMTIDGFVMLTTRDNFLYHEMISHPALFTHPAPKRIAIIGGGDCGTLQQVLKHDQVSQVTQIDIDERVTRLSEQYFSELCSNNQDPRAQLLFIDGIDWIRQATENSLDVVIVDSTDPVGPGEKLFSQTFYEHCYRALDTGGLLIQQSESPLLHLALIRAMRKDMAAAGFQHFKTLPFPQPCYPSGWWSATMTSKTLDLTQFRQAQVETKAFAAQYYNAAIHTAALAEPEFLKQAWQAS